MNENKEDIIIGGPDNYIRPKTESQPQPNTEGLKFDTGKLQYSLIPTETTKALAEVLTFGARKYAIDGWKYVPDAKRRYMDALIRHLEAFRSGELYDQESGLSHLSHVLANASFLHYFYSKD